MKHCKKLKVIHRITILEADVGLSLKVKLGELKNDQTQCCIDIDECDDMFMLNRLNAQLIINQNENEREVYSWVNYLT